MCECNANVLVHAPPNRGGVSRVNTGRTIHAAHIRMIKLLNLSDPSQNATVTTCTAHEKALKWDWEGMTDGGEFNIRKVVLSA